jgi:hypothetical protein
MRAPLAALYAVAAGGAALLIPPIPAGQAQAAWQTCSFNGRPEACVVAGGSNSFTLTFRSDGKQIEMEKVGEPWTSGPGDQEEFGKLLITEPSNGRTTLATYRQTSSTVLVRSERGNTYTIPYGRQYTIGSTSTDVKAV